MYKDTVTLFSLHNNVWYGTVIEKCDLNIDQAKILRRYGEDSKTRATLHIKVKGGKVADKELVKPADFDGNNFTVNTGNDFSFFIEGAYGELIIDDDEYVAEYDGFFDYMKKIQGAYACKGVAEYSVIPHLEIVGA